MKKLNVKIIVASMFLLGVGFMLGKSSNRYKVQNVFPPKYYTEDMTSLTKQDNTMQIVFADSVEGRPTYNILFSDSTILDSMYPEEIANGLITGKWDYNEDLTINNIPLVSLEPLDRVSKK